MMVPPGQRKNCVKRYRERKQGAGFVVIREYRDVRGKQRAATCDYLTAIK
jgi:hypothetical protein